MSKKTQQTIKNDEILVYTLPIYPNNKDLNLLNKRFKLGEKLYTRILTHIIQQIKQKKRDKKYYEAYHKHDKGASRNKILKELDKTYGLTEYSIQSYAIKYSKEQGWSKILGSQTAQALGNQAYSAYAAITFRKGKHINLNPTIDSLRSTSKYCLMIRKEHFKWNKMNIPIGFRRDKFEELMLQNEIRYIRLYREKINGKFNYTIQITYKGSPIIKEKHQHQHRYGTIGVDIGTSTVAISSPYGVMLRELAPSAQLSKDEEKEIRRLQRLADRQRRSNNPDNYNSDGTIKRGKKSWKSSKGYEKTMAKIAEYRRLSAARRKFDHNQLINDILSMGGVDRIVVEEMSFSGLAKRAKETEISEKTGKYKRKSRFGKSIGNRAPAAFISKLKTKAKLLGIEFVDGNTYKMKASQLDHTTNEYHKVSLSTRSKLIGGHRVQRDLYSAFLLQHVCSDGETIDIDDCNRDFELFLDYHNEEIERLKALDESHISSLGLSDFIDTFLLENPNKHVDNN